MILLLAGYVTAALSSQCYASAFGTVLLTCKATTRWVKFGGIRAGKQQKHGLKHTYASKSTGEGEHICHPGLPSSAAAEMPHIAQNLCFAPLLVFTS